MKEYNTDLFILQKNINNCLNKYTSKIDTYRSFLYLIRDLIYSTISIITTKFLLNYLNYYLVFILYSTTMGTILTGLWVIGHECGHGAFSKNKIINNSVGYIVHSSLLVPYFSWQYTHQKHHKYTNHLTLGETHVPPTKNEFFLMLKIRDIIGEDAFVIFNIFVHLILGWPAYLFFNSTGGKTQSDLKTRLKFFQFKDHFSSNSKILKKKFYPEISTFGCLFTIYLTIKYLQNSIIFWYIGPYIVVNSWLVLYTLLQHTDLNIPHYGSNQFTFLKGALSTIDRKYPYIIDCLHHHIGSTHVVHHLNYKIPHYIAKDTTEEIKVILGKYYNYKDSSIIKELYNINKYCLYVSSEDGEQYYKYL